MVDVARNWRELTAPPYEPVSTALARQWCRIDSDDDSQDDVLALLIKSARRRLESISGYITVERSIQVVMDDLPADDTPLELPVAPVQSLSYLRYLDAAGDEQELSGSPTPLIVDTVIVPNRLAPLHAESWPDTNKGPGNVRIGLVAGYAPTGSPIDEAAYQAAIPAELRQWLCARISTFYEQRESIVVGTTVVDVPRDYVDGLLDGLRVHRGFA